MSNYEIICLTYDFIGYQGSRCESTLLERGNRRQAPTRRNDHDSDSSGGRRGGAGGPGPGADGEVNHGAAGATARSPTRGW